MEVALFLILLCDLIVSITILYSVIQDKKEKKLVIKQITQPQAIYGSIKCEFCAKELPPKARRTSDNRWACDHCRITKLNQLEA